jgi:succinoglycan biosynthesis transport protein ExoP
MATTALESEPPSSGVNVNSVLYALFRHKWKVIFGACGGIIAAVAFCFLYPPVYESRAKLLVRYVLERSVVDSIDGANAASSSGRSMDSVIAAEAEILTSWDLAVQVAQAIGPKRLLPNARGPTADDDAARTISLALKVVLSPGSSIITVSYTNRDPEIATRVLEELISRYFIKHLEVHRSAGAFNFVTEQIDQVRTRLNEAEAALRPLLDRAGVVSLKETKANLSADATKTEAQLHAAEVELAEQRGRVTQMVDGGQPVTSSSTTTHPAGTDSSTPEAGASPGPVIELSQVSKEDIQQYQALILRLERLRKMEAELLTKYTPESQRVRINQRQIQTLDNDRLELEKKFPDISSKAATIGTITTTSTGQRLDMVVERAKVAGLEAKTESLRNRLREIQERARQLAELAPQIEEWERKRDLEEANYKYFAATLEKARVDEALDPSKMPNISAVQKPSPPIPMTTKRNKIALGLAGSGLAFGVAFALLSGLFLNRTVKRPLELETELQIPLMLSIPYANALNGQAALPSSAPGSGSALAIRKHNERLAPWESGHFIRPYCEAIRDRLGLYFELNHLTHKPKLVGVTGFSGSAGASTLAAGLAASLSETNDGKVLLVDINLGPEDVHPFFKGKPAYSLNAALKPNSAIASAADNLYLASVGSSNSGPAQLGLKKFFDMMPNLKASDFDYIIFDMPPLTQTSPTWGMAAFMDKLLLVVEAEKNNRDLIKRSYGKLIAERDNVAVVVNKARSYIPKWLDSES